MAGPWFGPEQGKVMVFVREIYGLKSYGSDFMAVLDEKLHDLGYRPSIYDLDVCMIPEVKTGEFM